MKEIEQRAKIIYLWRSLLDQYGIYTNVEWCACMGLCETAGWVDKNESDMLEWVKPGYKVI